MAVTIKNEEEIKRMRAAGKLTGQCLNMLAGLIKPGVTTLEIDEAAAAFIRAGGGVPAFLKYRGFPKNVCVSVNEELLHGVGTNFKKIMGGDIVSVDIGVLLNGYHGDAARTYTVGDADDETRRLVETAEKAFFEGIKYAKHGAHLHEICKAMQTCAESAGFSVVKEYVGHGIGKDLHEDPNIPCFKPPGRGQRLSRNMTFAIEPMLCAGKPELFTRPDKWTVATKDGKRCAHYENTILLTDGEPDVLTLI